MSSVKDKYPMIPEELIAKVEKAEKKDAVVLADTMKIKQFLLARKKYQRVMVPLEFQVGDVTLRKEVPCRLLTREEQSDVILLQKELIKLSNKLSDPPKTEKALKKLLSLSEKTLDKLYKFAVDLCLDGEFTFQFLKENEINLDVPLTILYGSAKALSECNLQLPKFRG